MAAVLLNVGGWDNLRREMEPFAKVVETLGGQSVVVVLPGELGLKVSTRGEGLASLDDIEVLGINVGMFGKVEVLLCDENSLAEDMLMNLLTVGLRNKHDCDFSICPRRGKSGVLSGRGGR